MLVSHHENNVANMVTRNGAPKYAANKGKNRPFCSHCEQHGHTKDSCFTLHGYPPGWKDKKFVKSANQNYKSNPGERNFVKYNSTAAAVHVNEHIDTSVEDVSTGFDEGSYHQFLEYQKFRSSQQPQQTKEQFLHTGICCCKQNHNSCTR